MADMRLTAAQEREVIAEFTLYRLPDDPTDEEFDAFAAGCTVLYRDDHDSGQSSYQVVDAEGCGDGSGEWYPVTWDAAVIRR